MTSSAPQLHELYAENYVKLVRLAALLVDDRETAEEVVQDAFVRVYARWSKVGSPEHALAYVRAAVVNGARDALRRRRRSAASTAGSGTSYVLDEGVIAGGSPLWDAVTALPMRQREVLVLRYFLDQSIDEVARTLGISSAAVKAATTRALESLRHDWTRHD